MPNNIIITPGSASIQFSGSANNDTIRLQVEPSGSVAFYGNNGSLFSITDSLSGSLMSVNDISGLPILEVFSDDRVVMGTFNRNTLVVTGSRVGIGTATPSTNLHLYTTSTGAEILVEKSNTYANRFGVNSSNVAYVGSTNATALQLQTNASARLYIDTSGNVGIGTTSPGSLLHVQGTVSASSYTLDSTAAIYKSGGRLTVRSESTDDVANFGSYGLYLPKTGQTAGLYAESAIEARNGIRLGSGATNGTIDYGATTTNTGNRLVLRDANGDINSRYANSSYVNTSDDVSSGTITYIMAKFGDNYYRSATAAKVASFISGQTMNISGTSTNITAYTINQSVGTSNDVQFRRLGVGTSPGATDGEIRATNEVTAYYSSDARLKENIIPLNNALNKLLRINGVEFDWTTEHIDSRGGEDGYFVRKHDVGVIAQEIQEVLPEVVAERTDGYLAVRYEKIVPLLIEAIKELQAEVAELKKQR